MLDKLRSVNPNIVFVAFGGSPFVCPWLGNTRALLNMYLGGQAVMQAAYDLLFGNVCPSGRLAETFPLKLTDTPCYNYFANDRYVDEHRESLFVGYRYYSTYGIKTQFPFGYGLSYTKFTYGNFTVTKADGGFKVKVNVTNVGETDGYEVVQIYVDNCDCGLLRAKRELRAFNKVFVKAGQTVEVELFLSDRAFSVYYDNAWRIVKGGYTVSVCSDVENVIASAHIFVDGEAIKGRDRELYPDYYDDVVGSFSVSEDAFYKLANQVKAEYTEPKRGEFTLLNTFEDMEQSVGLVRTLKKYIRKTAIKMSPSKSINDPVAQMTYRGAMQTPLISIMSVGGIPSKYVMFILHHANKRFGKAVKALLGR